MSRRFFTRAWIVMFAVHALAVAAIHAWSRAGMPAALRDPLGVFAVLSLYGPIALATKLGVPRASLERAAWLFGEITLAGWIVVIASWLAVHALLAALWTAWRARRSTVSPASAS